MRPDDATRGLVRLHRALDAFEVGKETFDVVDMSPDLVLHILPLALDSQCSKAENESIHILFRKLLKRTCFGVSLGKKGQEVPKVVNAFRKRLGRTPCSKKKSCVFLDLRTKK